MPLLDDVAPPLRIGSTELGPRGQAALGRVLIYRVRQLARKAHKELFTRKASLLREAVQNIRS